MDEPPNARFSTRTVQAYGTLIRSLRSMTLHTVDKETKWRHRGPVLDTGYRPTW